ncbi:MAG: GGDEF domain-containing protein [Gammaproteobacteria bacterium]
MAKSESSRHGIAGMWHHVTQHSSVANDTAAWRIGTFWSRWFDLRFPAPLEHAYVRNNSAQAVLGIRIALMAITAIVLLSIGLDALLGGVSVEVMWRLRLPYLMVAMGLFVLSYVNAFAHMVSLVVWLFSVVVTATFLSLSVVTDHELTYFYAAGLAPALLLIVILSQMTLVKVMLVCGVALIVANTYWANHLQDGLEVRWFLWNALFVLTTVSGGLLVSQWERWRRQQFLDHQKIELAKFSAMELEQQSEKLTFLVSLDAVLGVANRKSFDRALRQEWRRATRNRQSVAILLVEVSINQKTVQTTPDLTTDPGNTPALIDVCRLAAGVTRRPGDLVARYDDNCVVILLIDTDRRHALALSSKLRNRLFEQWSRKKKSHPAPYNMSIGVSSILPNPVVFPADLMGNAEAALIRARENESGVSDVF